MKTDSVKKISVAPAGIVLISLSVILFNSCKKEVYSSERNALINENSKFSNQAFPTVPKIDLPLTRCVQSYQDILDVLGSNSVQASAVILDNGVTIYPGGDLKTITYEITPPVQGNSIFTSKLLIEWRWPGGNWQINTSEVWSLGCSIPPPSFNAGTDQAFTNMIKAGNTILVNTCFYWPTNEYTGARVAYLVID